MSQVFNILIHERLLPAFRALAPEVRAAVQKCCERLQFGYWGGGTRVKLLHGARRLVYEARVNRGWRLLFTATRLPAVQPPHTPEPHLLIWDLADHDHLDRARRLNLQPEAGFLDYAEVAARELADTPAHPDCPVPDGSPATPALLDQLLADAAAAAPPPEELGEAVRWYELAPDLVLDPAEWQALLDEPELNELELKLSEEQARTLYAPGPVLLRGTAGSGKTTVSVYRLVRACLDQPQARIVYVTYSEALLNVVRRLFADLFRARRRPPPAHPPEFRTFPELYRRLAGQAATTAAGRPPLRYPFFAQWYRALYRLDDAALAWEEIRGIVKGGCRDLQRDYLSAGQYEELGRKRAPLFVNERPRLYRVFQKYHEWCAREGHADDLDLARQAARAVAAARDRQPYDFVLCDEGQDLTELELALLLKLVRHPDGLFFTADPQQVVNPSGFRWAEVRTLLREASPHLPAPPLLSLTRNYRSVAGIVALANALLRLQRERTGRGDDDEFQDTQLAGATPVLVTGAEAAVTAALRDFGPRCAVVVASDAEAERLAALLHSERVFSVTAAKGLEFDACVVWNLLSADLPLWRTIVADPQQPLKEHPAARRVLRHLYVALTRARRYLGIFETQAAAADLWRAAPFRACLEADTPEGLSRFMVFAASPADWEKEGDYFEARGRYRQAAECFHRAGQATREWACHGRFAESLGEFGRAAEAFTNAGDRARAAACHEQAGQPAAAARLFSELGDWAAAGRAFEKAGAVRAALEAYARAKDDRGQQRCRLALLVEAHDWPAAARLAAHLGDRAAAISHYERAGNRDAATRLRLEHALATGDHLTAGRLLEDQREFARAAAAFRAAGAKGERPARRCEALLAEQRQDWAAAAAAWADIGDPQRHEDCRLRHCEGSGAWREAAEIYKRRQQTAALQRCLEQNRQQPQAAAWLAALAAERRQDRAAAALAYEDAGRDVEAAALATAYLEHVKAMPRQHQAWHDPAHWREQRDVTEVLVRGEVRALRATAGATAAAKCQFTARSTPKTLALLRDVAVEAGLWKRAGKACEYLREFALAATYYERGRDRLNLNRVQALAAEAAGDHQAAGTWWAAAKKPKYANKNYGRAAEQAGDYAAATEFYARAGLKRDARRLRQAAPVVPAVPAGHQPGLTRPDGQPPPAAPGPGR